MVLSQQKIRFVRTLNTAGEAFTRAIARDIGMELIQAEQYKVAYGLSGTQLEGKIGKSILPIFRVIVDELQKAHNFFLQKEPNQKINSLIVCGGGALMLDLNSYLAQNISLEIVALDPFKNFTTNEKVNQIKAKSKFSVAAGLALRGE